MNEIGLYLGLLGIPAGAAIACWNRIKTRRTMNRIGQMLDAAIAGEFTESSFDESKLSALETRFAHYLSAAEISSRNVAQEKDKIKSLIADISHQTKTPIANLLLYSEMLMEENFSQTTMGNIEAIHYQSKKLQFLIDSLVKLSRLENGIITLSEGKHSLRPILERITGKHILCISS